MDRVLHFVLALAVVAVLALLVSSDRKKKFAFVTSFSYLLSKYYWPGSS